MGRLPYFPLYPTDFEAKTSHLTLMEDGAYNRLLRLMWMTPGCSIPDDDAWIKRRMRCSDEEFQAVLTVIDEFCIRKAGRVSNAKLTEVFEATNASHEKRVQAGKIGGQNKALKNKQNSPGNAKAKPKQPEPEPEPYIEENTSVFSLRVFEEPPDRFEEFWDQYPHRGGAKKGKAAARKSWDRAVKSKTDPSHIIQGAMRYATDAQVLRGYAKDPSTWLNQQCWHDDVEQQPSIGAGSGSSSGMVAAFAAVAARRTSH